MSSTVLYMSTVSPLLDCDIAEAAHDTWSVRPYPPSRVSRR